MEQKCQNEINRRISFSLKSVSKVRMLKVETSYKKLVKDFIAIH